MKRAWLAVACIGLLGPCPFVRADCGGDALDARARALLQRDHAAGAVLVVVDRNGTLLSRGYGAADVEAGRPMTPDTTLVHAGSISKLFTGIAVLQLVADGRLDLDRDVNAYLDFHVPTPAGGVPVTLRRLLTHRAGFEEHAKGLFTRGPAPRPLGPWLADSLPRRLFPNGDVSSYSNFGVALAGYVVERAAGMPFHDDVAARILRPLGMEHSTFRQPLPPELAPLMARGYVRADRPPLPFVEVLQAAPAGALATTGTDMGRFMRALLRGGELDGARILDAETLRSMMAPQVATPAGRMGLSFFEKDVAGRRSIGHDGATTTFFSALSLLPAEGLGVFASVDGAGAAGAPEELVAAAVEACAPPAPSATPPGVAGVAVGAPSGAYQTSRRAESTLLRLNALIAQVVFMARSDGSVVERRAPWWSGGTRFVPAGAGLFRSAKGRLLALDARGSVHAGPPAQEWQKVPWWLDARCVLPAVLAAALAAVAVLLFGRVAAAVRALLALDIVVLAASGALFASALRDYTVLGDALDPWLALLYGAAWACVAGAVSLPVAVARAWSGSSRRTRIGSALAIAASLVLAWFFVVFRLAGTTLNY